MKNFDAVKYLTKANWQKCKPGLSRIRHLLGLLDNPQNKLKFIHVAGTNGKGSVCAYISQILIESGYKVGQFTSPYIWDFNERIKINNVSIDTNKLDILTMQIAEIIDNDVYDDEYTEFEILTALAFIYFLENKCDLVVCEVGMGGRLDSTNIIPAKNLDLCIITQISLDHTQFLGNNILSICKEKAGIIKNNSNVVMIEQDKTIMEFFSKICIKRNATLNIVDIDKIKLYSVNTLENKLYRKFDFEKYKNCSTSLIAKYQPLNASQAIKAVNVISDKYGKISDVSVKKGIKNCKWPGRFDVVNKNPYLIIDGGHNEQGVKVLKESLIDVFGNKKFVFIFGVLSDKNYRKMITIIAPIAKKVYCITPPNPRAYDSKKLVTHFISIGIEARAVDIDSVVKIAYLESNETDIICAFGSLYSISSLIKKQ